MQLLCGSKNVRCYSKGDADYLNGFLYTSAAHICRIALVQDKRADTVGQPLSIEIGVPNMPSLKAKRLSKLLREKVLLEL